MLTPALARQHRAAQRRPALPVPAPPYCSPAASRYGRRHLAAATAAAAPRAALRAESEGGLRDGAGPEGAERGRAGQLGTRGVEAVPEGLCGVECLNVVWKRCKC